jgi:DNA-binding HxlR family transcriptional regulator
MGEGIPLLLRHGQPVCAQDSPARLRARVHSAGAAWALEIVLLLRIANGHQRPGELARTIPQASRRVLDAQLLELVAHGVVRKTVFDEVIQHVEYELTELGQSLLPVITVMGEWGSIHIQHLRETIK